MDQMYVPLHGDVHQHLDGEATWEHEHVGGADTHEHTQVQLLALAADNHEPNCPCTICEARRNCTHPDFEVHCAVNRIVQEGIQDGVDADGGITHRVHVTELPSALCLDVEVRCGVCSEPLVFHGRNLEVGLLPDRPTISVSGRELRVPARPLHSDPSFGLGGFAGFRVRVVEGDPSSDN